MVLGGLLVLTIMVMVFTFRIARQDGVVVSASGAVRVKNTSEMPIPGNLDTPALLVTTARHAAQLQNDDVQSTAVVVTEAESLRNTALAVWESLVDQVIEQKDLPTEEQSRRVKTAFAKLEKVDQMEGLRRALNLLPDEQFPVLYAIFFDKLENVEILDAIFSDALNRPATIKNPLLKDLRKDREHPMFFEATRILDAIGE